MSTQTLSLYIHVPFCSTRCGYCHFNTYEGLERLFEPFTAALCAEIAEQAAVHRRDWTVQSIFIGGGTPTHLPIGCFEQIAQSLRMHWNWTSDMELSSEANPSFITQSYLDRMRAAGVNRLSFGAQSFDNMLLKMLDREHDAEQVGRAVESARAAGFDNVNLDLMYGLPLQTFAQWSDTLDTALTLGPEHLSLYGLTIDEGTAFKKRVELKLLPKPDDDLAADMYIHAEERLASSGFEQYEISNWARPTRDGQRQLTRDSAPAPDLVADTYACRHNLTYWLNEPYLGFGPGAHSWFDHERSWNLNLPQIYIEKTANFQTVVAGREHIEPRLERAETAMLGLRLNDGISRTRFSRRFGVSLDEEFGETFERCRQWGLLSDDGERVRLTQRGRLLSNEVFMRLLPD